MSTRSCRSGMSRRSTDPAGAGSALDLPGYRFADPAWLERALTHRSYGQHNNERLEFLGDAVLGMVVAALLFRARGNDSEGDLSRLRARLVRETTLADIARELDLGEHLRLGPGELKSGGFLRDSILADALEAVIGAVYLDGGFESARGLVERIMHDRLAQLPDAATLKDAKTRLQELLQGRGFNLPEYQVVDERGADHARQFTVTCSVEPLGRPLVARAGSRRKAEQAAARLAIEALNEQWKA